LPTDPNQLGGYAYAGNNPLAKSDPSGLMFPIEDREPAGKPMGGGGRGGDDGNSGGGGGGGGGGKCSGRFCVGSPNAPAGHTGADDGFKYDPTAKATWGDRLSWAKWGARRSGCAATSWFNFGPCGDNHQGMKLYSHYREGNGTPMDIDYEAGWDQDEKIRGDITSEILSAQKAAEKLAKGEGNLFSITGRSRHIADQPDTPEWQNTLGSYDQWSSADVQVTGKRMTMRIRVTAYDRYNFNPGAKAVQTGLSDDENGRFAVLGWAKGFNTSGTIERTVTWTVGSPSGGVISGGKNR